MCDTEISCDECCGWCNNDEDSTKPLVFGSLSGLFFGIGWILFIDSVVVETFLNNKNTLFTHCLPGIGATLSFFFVNFIPWNIIAEGGDDYNITRTSAICFQVTFYVCALLGIGSIIGIARIYYF